MNRLHRQRWIIGLIFTFLAFLCYFIPSLIRETPSQVAFADVVNATTAGLDMTNYPQADQSVIRSKLGLEPSEFPGLNYYRSSNAMQAEEMLIIQFDPAQQKQVLDAVDQRIESQKQVYEGYAPEQLAEMQNAIISVHPNYLLYVTGAQGELARSQFEEAL